MSPLSDMKKDSAPGTALAKALRCDHAFKEPPGGPGGWSRVSEGRVRT